MLAKEDLIDGKIYYHRTEINEWIITFKRFEGNSIFGYNCVCKTSDFFRSDEYENSTTEELREATSLEIKWLQTCLKKNYRVPLEDIKFNEELEIEIW